MPQMRWQHLDTADQKPSGRSGAPGYRYSMRLSVSLSFANMRRRWCASFFINGRLVDAYHYCLRRIHRYGASRKYSLVLTTYSAETVFTLVALSVCCKRAGAGGRGVAVCRAGWSALTRNRPDAGYHGAAPVWR